MQTNEAPVLLGEVLKVGKYTKGTREIWGLMQRSLVDVTVDRRVENGVNKLSKMDNRISM